MLELSTAAAEALRQARDAQELPEDYGVRVSAQSGTDGQAGLGLEFVEEPAEGDHVAEQAGTPLYVAPDLAEPLADSVIDVEDTPRGAQLVVKPQQP